MYIFMKYFRLFEVVETYSKLHLVMEYVSGGELYQKLTSEGRMKEPDAKSTFAQILSAVKHLVRKLFYYIRYVEKYEFILLNINFRDQFSWIYLKNDFNYY